VNPHQRAEYTLILGDAFEWLTSRRARSIHAVVTDPPYGIVEYQPEQLRKRASGNGGIWRLPQCYDGYERRPIPRFTILGPKHHRAIRKFHRKLATLLFKVLVPGGHVIIASQTLLAHLVAHAFTNAGFEMRGQIARTVNTLRGGDRPKFAHKRYSDVSVIPRSAWEPWLVFRKPCEGLVKDNLAKWGTGALRRPATDIPFKDFIASSSARNPERRLADHPSLKPQAFMRQIAFAALPLGKGVILDPFAGSGATLAAAAALGLRSVGIEVNRTYYNMARRAIPQLAGYRNGMDELPIGALGKSRPRQHRAVRIRQGRAAAAQKGK
jgi:DNA modification methylase